MNTPYGTPTPPPSASSPVNGTLILVLGILSFFCFGIILGPVAWVMGNGALQTLDQYGDPASQRGTVSAGRICGIIGTVLSILGIIGYIVLLALGLVGHHLAPNYAPSRP